MHQREQEKCARQRRAATTLVEIVDEIHKSRHLTGVTHEISELFDGLKSDMIQGASLALGGSHVGEALGGRILDP